MATRVLEEMKGQKRKGVISQRSLTSGNHHHCGLEEQKCYLKPRDTVSLRRLLAAGAQLSEQESGSLCFQVVAFLSAATTQTHCCHCH